jgi:lipopolysaccharide transport system permease protein
MEYQIRPKDRPGLGLAELWQYRELFFFFTWRDIKIKYKQTFFGFAWAVLQPLLLMLIFTYFFAARLRAGEMATEYPVFVFSGLIIWTIFASGLTNAGSSMVTNAHIIKKIYFPRLIIPLSSVLVALFDFLMAFAVFIGLLFWYKQDVDLTRALLCMPAGIFLAAFATLGPGMLLAALNVKYRDFRYVIPFLVQALLFLSPVIYPAASEKAKLLFAFNPVSGAIDVFRSGLTGAPVELNYLLISLGSSLFFFLAGIIYFRRTEYYFADLA